MSMSKLSMLSESTGVPYSQLVEQKREGNRNFMIDSGLLSAKRAISDTKSAESVARKVSAAKRKKQKENAPPLEKRKSPRLSPDGSASASSGSNYFVPEPEPVPSEFFHDRLNSGENIDVFSAIALDEGEEEDEDYIRDRAGITDMRDQLVSAAAKSTSTSKSKSANKNNFTSARPVMLNDNVEKLTNQRAYGITTHPTLPVVVIGDKVGSVGLWNSSKSAQNSQTAFFTIAKRPIHSVQFNPTGDKLYMSSTDGTIREWDTNSPSNVLTQVFASYDDHADFKNEPGFGVEKDGKFWTSHSVLNSEANGIYVTSNCGTLINVDFRTASKVVFDVALSTHKLNTLSLHGNGHSVAVGGNEGVAKIFDIRALKKNKKKSVCTPVATYNSTRSINSAMFNCDGSCLAVTSFDDTIVLIDNPATLAGEMKYDSKIAHNNQTGKWLSTFHAVWHPNDSRYFACGSMKQPRCVEVLDRTKKGNAMVVATARGDYLSAVCSRVSFHPILPLLYGANSSGRVTRIDLVCE